MRPSCSIAIHTQVFIRTKYLNNTMQSEYTFKKKLINALLKKTNY